MARKVYHPVRQHFAPRLPLEVIRDTIAALQPRPSASTVHICPVVTIFLAVTFCMVPCSVGSKYSRYGVTEREEASSVFLFLFCRPIHIHLGYQHSRRLAQRACFNDPLRRLSDRENSHLPPKPQKPLSQFQHSSVCIPSEDAFRGGRRANLCEMSICELLLPAILF